MITPTPTTPIDRTLARGLLGEWVAQTATKPEMVKMLFPGTSYELHLVPATDITCEKGKRIVGRIAGAARRVDVVMTGGRYVEPVYGNPRRVQGTIVSTNDATNVIVVDAGMPIHLTLTDARQKGAQFALGQLVSCDVMDGTTFHPETGR
ncbi:MAG: hypothetical protein H7Y88_04100 [Phycisphaerales bacterium]|nr:hypothetical protein [Phycisphaerales bacterium]